MMEPQEENGAAEPPAPPQIDPRTLIDKIIHGHRPPIPSYLYDFSKVDSNIAKLLAVVPSCWHSDPEQRPSFQGVLMDLTSKILQL